MFKESEVEFIRSECKKLAKNIETRLSSNDLAEQQQRRLEERMEIALSVVRKLEHQDIPIAKTPNVLIVDDMKSALEINKQFLMQIGFKKIDTAFNGSAALTQLKQASSVGSPYGLVICDWEMPKMSGLELLQEVREDEELWSTPFFLLTSKSEKKDIVQAISTGATGYFSKPVNPASLETKLKSYIVA